MDDRVGPIVRVGLRTTLALGLLVAPALAEAHARQQLDDGLAARGVDAREVSIGPLGFHARGLQTHLAGHQVRLGELSVRPTLDGIRVQVSGVEVQAGELQPTSTKLPESTPTAAESSAHGKWSRVEKARALGRRLRGVPVSIELVGPVELTQLSPHPELAGAHIEGLEAELRSDGHVQGKLRAGLDIGETPYQLEFDFASNLDEMAPLRVAGQVQNATLGRVEVQAEAAADRFAARAELADGRIDLKGRGLVQARNAEAELSFEAFPVGDLATFVEPRARALGVDLSWGELVLDGQAHLNREAGGWRADAREMSLRGLTIESPHLARRPVSFDEVGLEADLRTNGGAHSAVLTLSHKATALVFSGHYSDEGLSLQAEVAPVSCQEFLDSAPRGLFHLLEGMQLAGDIEARASLDMKWDTLHTWVAEQEAAKAEVRMPDESVPPPGKTELHFPLLESCRVTREAPGLSVERVKGAYRHRFTGGDGVEHQRVLAPGAPNFSALASSRDFSRAFTILEDARFWAHDGFDREHIERALWHDLSVGAMARGASTITQQTARNLWLGLDRSVSRKLQEAFLAARLEKEVGKRRIMEIYMNIIELGPEVYGIEQAARFHFGRPARELNLLEALHIASLAPSPVRLSKRFENGHIDDEWRAHLEEQVRRLRIHGFISREEARAAKRLPVALLDRANTPN